MKKNIEDLKVLFEDKEFCEKINACTSANEYAKVIASYGFDLDPEEFANGVEYFKARQEAGELTDEELDAVTGGSVLVAFASILLFTHWPVRFGVPTSSVCTGVGNSDTDSAR